jgi:glycosyltransferase involved in cell wall biosynthesis
MALAEAIAHGLPVVSTMAGAIPDTIPAGAGLLVPPNDVAALAQALRRLISDRAERQRLAMNARAAAARRCRPAALSYRQIRRRPGQRQSRTR